MSKARKLKVISLFSGAGGLDLGFHGAGFEVAVCVEADTACCDTLRKNWPDTPVLLGDIREISTKEILNVAKLSPLEPALVIGGPPCQPFSLAGKRQGFQDTRGTLFMEFVRVIRETLPVAFVMENVKGLKNWNGGQALETILKELSDPFLFEGKEYRYTVVHDCLNAVDYGVPQKRERVFFVGTRNEKQFVFPDPTHFPPEMLNGIGEKWKTVNDALRLLPQPDAPSATAQRVSKTIRERHKKCGYE